MSGDIDRRCSGAVVPRQGGELGAVPLRKGSFYSASEADVGWLSGSSPW